jgi:hypothetical protein
MVYLWNEPASRLFWDTVTIRNASLQQDPAQPVPDMALMSPIGSDAITGGLHSVIGA